MSVSVYRYDFVSQEREGMSDSSYDKLSSPPCYKIFSKVKSNRPDFVEVKKLKTSIANSIK
jgi:hypothetical protein